MPRTAPAVRSRSVRPLASTEPRPDSLAAERDPLLHEVEGLRYQLDALPRRHGRKSVITVRLAESDTGPPLVDRCDLFSFRSRRAFAQLVADVFARDTGQVLGQLALVLDACERARSSQPRTQSERLTPERRRAAEELLAHADLLDRAAAVMEQLGYVGEEAPKRLAFLVAVSRLLAKPLSAIVFAPSGSGKSELLEAVARLMPEESVEFLSRLTPQALFYAGSESLRHKLVLVDEQVGATEADHSIRTLQSRGVLRLAIPVKGKTESFEARGPIALMSGTTSESINPENLSRCLELVLDDSPAQTERVQVAQRRAAAGKGAPAPDLQVWRDAQRILEPCEVVIPFAEKLSYAARTSADRRGNAKLLGLIMAHGLLCQRQRQRDPRGRVVATLADYRVIYELLQPTVTREIDGLSPRAARLFKLLQEAPPAAISRREVAARLGWAYMTAARALEELERVELVCALEGREVPRRYQLAERIGALQGAKLTAPDRLR
jgi:energy-coupling factor transporter ATP-binding protein EcfA2